MILFLSSRKKNTRYLPATHTQTNDTFPLQLTLDILRKRLKIE